MYPGQETIAVDWKFRGYFTPALWSPQRQDQYCRAEWDIIRRHFGAARSGQFQQLDTLLESKLSLNNPLTNETATFLLGDAGTDAQHEAIMAWIDDAPPFGAAAELCDSLAVWGRLAAVEHIHLNYNHNTFRKPPGEYEVALEAMEHPAYFTTMLEPEWGPLARAPNGDGDAIAVYEDYDKRVHAAYEEVLAKVGDENTIVVFGETFGVRQLAERLLDHLGDSGYEKMMQPFFRRRFEASTGIDCSFFYQKRNFQALTVAARIEAWLDSEDAQRYELGARYFFGHRIPSTT
ncbi:hypothetical protein [Enhygromyxa salina]|uniref:Uncharacterized protein n=1 Tax=Enhygromyxa salina TaxID=215803 RepID=A0A2S9YML1_9BACT|nr:hypothetical protein [Enhygromyxa salina]PRQ06324.1 hypothetical protein ENSA7_40010 [Enhygromyxa salina]